MKNISLISLKVVRERSIPYANNQITCPQNAYDIIKGFIGDTYREYFGVVMMSNSNEVNAIEICSIGTLNATLVSPREVFKSAIVTNSSSVMLFHSHPSGNIKPSIEDKETTRMLDKASQLLGIPIVDHIILGNEAFYSFASDGFDFGRSE